MANREISIEGDPRFVLDGYELSVALGTRAVLDRVSLQMQAGTLCVLAGPNGAGKSTLIRSLAGLVRLTTGVNRHDVTDIAYLPQDRTVHWDLSVARVVALGRLPRMPSIARGASQSVTADDSAAIARAMGRMDILHLAARSIREVSGGERARVLIARALAQETPVLLADEPVAGLDPAHQLILFEHLRRLAREGRAVLVALHDLSLAARYADRVVLLHQGRIVADGSPADCLSRDRIASVFGIESRTAVVEGVPVIVPLSPVGDRA